MLAVDVGNTHITCAVMEGAEIRLVRRVPTETCLREGSFFDLLDLNGVPLPGEIVLSSVREPVTAIIVRESSERLQARPFVVTRDTPMGIINLYRSRNTLGTDRLVGAAACYHLHTRGERPGIVVDMGTATTIDYITEKGEFAGGAIAPGLLSAYRGLLVGAPELPEIELQDVSSAIGTTTQDCIRSGVIAGHAAMIIELSAQMARERMSSPLVVVTGGLAVIIRSWLPKGYLLDENLTLKGLQVIYQVNKESAQDFT